MDVVVHAQGTLLSFGSGGLWCGCSACGCWCCKAARSPHTPLQPATLHLPGSLLTPLRLSARHRWLRDFQHIRYMWLPYTDSAVVVRSNPLKSDAEAAKAAQPPAFSEEQRLEPLRGGLHLCRAPAWQSYSSCADGAPPWSLWCGPCAAC